MTDKEIIQALIDRDEKVTRKFFLKDCRPLFTAIICKVFPYDVDYDEFVNEFYLYLMENNAYRLKQFEGRSTIYQWLKTTAIRYFLAKRDNVIDMNPKESPIDSEKENQAIEEERKTIAKMDVEKFLSLMSNKRYAYVIKRLVLQEAEPGAVAEELDTNISNLYNIKKRAIAAITEVALKATNKYEKRISK